MTGMNECQKLQNVSDPSGPELIILYANASPTLTFAQSQYKDLRADSVER